MTFDTLGYLVHMSHKIARRTARFSRFSRRPTSKLRVCVFEREAASKSDPHGATRGAAPRTRLSERWRWRRTPTSMACPSTCPSPARMRRSRSRWTISPTASTTCSASCRRSSRPWGCGSTWPRRTCSAGRRNSSARSWRPGAVLVRLARDPTRRRRRAGVCAASNPTIARARPAPRRECDAKCASSDRVSRAPDLTWTPSPATPLQSRSRNRGVLPRRQVRAHVHPLRVRGVLRQPRPRRDGQDQARRGLLPR